VAEVKRGFGRNNAYIEFDGSSAILHKIPGVTVLNKTENTAEIALDSNLITAPKLIRELADKIDIYKFDTKEPSLHEIFIEVVSKKEVSHE
jgi:ABC-2 type transport system ATP-binding protein